MATIQKRGSGWRVLIRKTGYPTQTQTFKTKTAAEKWARATESAMDSNAFTLPDKVTVEDIFMRYYKEVAKDRWTRNRILQLLTQFPFRLQPANVIDHDHIKQWRDSRIKEVSGATVNREWNVIGGVYNHAIKEWGIVHGENPARKVKRPPKGAARNRRITDKEFSDLREHLGWAVDKSPRTEYGGAIDLVFPVFEFAIETAMRQGEILRLRWQDIDTTNWTAHLPKTKNGDARHVPLSARAEQIVKLMPKVGEYVFPIKEAVLGVYFRKACKKLGIVDLHFHDTRHEGTTRLARRLDVRDLAAVVGHRDLNSLLVYYNPTPQELSARLRNGSA